MKRQHSDLNRLHSPSTSLERPTATSLAGRLGLLANHVTAPEADTAPYWEAVNFTQPTEYVVGRQIGEGILSCVHLATEVETDRSVVVKIPKQNTWQANQAIKHEFRTIRQLAHPGIVPCQRLWRLSDRFALVMEPLQGVSLTSVVRGSLPLNQLPNLSTLAHQFYALASTLAHAHQRGWVHGDITPAHARWNRAGEACWIDWEMASRVERPHWTATPGRLRSTHAYLAPELIIDTCPAQPASDIYSLGRLLSLCLSGHLPSLSLADAPAERDDRIAGQLPSDTPLGIRTLCTDMLRLEPEERPATSEVLTRIENEWSSDANLPLPISGQPFPNPVAVDIVQAANYLTNEALEKRQRFAAIQLQHGSPESLERAIQRASGNQPRLVLPGLCTTDGHDVWSGWDQVFERLGDWIRNLPPAILQAWRPTCRDSIAVTSPALAAAFQIPPAPFTSPSEVEIEQSTNCLVRLLGAISKQRRLVIVLHDIEHLNRAAGRMLEQLLNTHRIGDLSIVASYKSAAAVESNSAAHSLLRIARRYHD